MRLLKSDLMAALRAGLRVAGARAESGWTRACRLEASGLGDEVTVTCWGSGASTSVVVPGDATPGECHVLATAAAAEQAGHAIGDHVEVFADPRGVAFRSAGREGVVVTEYEAGAAPPDPRAPSEGDLGVVRAPAALARALRLAADVVDHEGVGDRYKVVAVQATEPGVVVLGTDGASCVWSLCDVAVKTRGALPQAALLLEHARAVADLVEAYAGADPVSVDADHRGVRVRAGRAVLEVLSTASGAVTAGQLDQLIARHGQEGRVTGVDLRALLDAVRFASTYATKETSSTTLRVLFEELVVDSPGSLGSTRIACRSRSAGQASYACARLARALAGVGAGEREASALYVPLGGAGPLQVVTDGDGWRRRHFVMPLAPGEGTT